MRASSPFFRSSTVRLTAVVLIVVLILFTNTACDFILDASLRPGQPTPIKYDIQLMAYENSSGQLVYHSDLQDVRIEIKRQDNDLLLKEDHTDYQGQALLTILNDYAQEEAKLVVNDLVFPLEKDIVLGDTPLRWTIIYYEDKPPQFNQTQMVMAGQSNVNAATPNQLTEYRDRSHFLLYSTPFVSGNSATGDGDSSTTAPAIVTPTPVVPIWYSVCQESFDAPKDSWTVNPTDHDNGDIMLRIQQGRLRQISNFSAENRRLKFQTPCQSSSDTLRLEIDVIFGAYLNNDQTTAVLIFSQTGSHADGTENYYAVSLSNEGEYTIGKKQQNNYSDLVTTQRHEAIQASSPNRIRIELIRGTISLFVNDTLLHSQVDTQPLYASGAVWLGVDGPADSANMIEFDNINLSQLQN